MDAQLNGEIHCSGRREEQKETVMEGTANLEYRKSTRTTNCCCDRLPSELLARIFELVVESAWKEGPQATPSVVEMGTFPGRRLDDDQDQLQIDAKPDDSYPRVIFSVCTRWRAVTRDTPSLWSYISMTDDSTSKEMSLSLQRSKSFPLSIRVTALSQMSEMDRLGIQVDRTQSQIERRLDRLQSQIERGLDRLKSRIERKMDMMEIRLAGFGSVLELEPIADDTLELGPIADDTLELGPIADDTLDLDPLAPFKEKMSLLLQHADRWRRFHIVAAQTLFINSTAALFAQGNRDAPFLQEFRLETSRSWQDMWSVNAGVERTPSFTSAVPSLQRLTLYCGILPVEIGLYPSLPHSMFPGLRELELAKMEQLDHLLCFGILRGLPHLRALKLIDVGFKYVDTLEAVADVQRIVLGALEELSLEKLEYFTFRPILEFLSAPNLQMMSFRELDGFGLFIKVIQNKSLFSNLRNLKMQSMRISDRYIIGDPEAVRNLYEIMPEITSIHIDSASQALKDPLIQGGVEAQSFVNKRVLLPVLSEISLSGFVGEEIIKLVKARRNQGVPVKLVRIDRRSIVSGAVSLKDSGWETLKSLVDTLRWFDTDTDSDEFRRRI